MRDIPLRELAKVIRSKNAGPFEVTFDVIFDRKSAYEEVKASGALTAEKLARLYNIPVDDILVANPNSDDVSPLLMPAEQNTADSDA